MKMLKLHCRGYSGGTIATGWAAQLQPRYAPELKGQLIGAAVGDLSRKYHTLLQWLQMALRLLA